MALDIAGQSLLPGDRVIYTSRSRLYFGIVVKANPFKTTIKETTREFIIKQPNLRFLGTSIDNNKIYKLNV